MLAFIVSYKDKNDWIGSGIIGQTGDKLVIEAPAIPTCDHEEITDIRSRFTQRVFDGKFGTEITYSELVYIRGLLDELGEYGKEAASLSELKVRKEITDIQLALVEAE